MRLLGQRHELGRGIDPKGLVALPVQFSHVAARPTANIEYATTGRKGACKPAGQGACNFLIALGHRMRMAGVIAKGSRVHGLLYYLMKITQ
jgi:hypothetical protein